jgi:hypothetical protein
MALNSKLSILRTAVLMETTLPGTTTAAQIEDGFGSGRKDCLRAVFKKKF